MLAFKLLILLTTLILGFALLRLILRSSNTVAARIRIFLLLSLTVLLPLIAKWYSGGAVIANIPFVALFSIGALAFAGLVAARVPLEGQALKDKVTPVVQMVCLFFLGQYATFILKLIEDLGLPLYVNRVMSVVVFSLVLFLSYYEQKKRS